MEATSFISVKVALARRLERLTQNTDFIEVVIDLMDPEIGIHLLEKEIRSVGWLATLATSIESKLKVIAEKRAPRAGPSREIVPRPPPPSCRICGESHFFSDSAHNDVGWTRIIVS